jgi:LysR family hydrogen peroxide-inducible transcriptional activator
MNIKDLKYLVAVADAGHFGKAAEACFVSQPALSMQIMKLESDLGVQLLERTNKSVMLTEHGKLIVERARQILNQVEEVREVAKSARDPLSGECRIGIIPTLAPYLLPLVIPSIINTYPKLSLYLVEEQTAQLIEKLKQGKLHAAILALPVNEKSFSSIPLFEEEFMLAVPAKVAMAKLKIIKQQDLNNKNLLLLDEGHCLRDQALAFCQRMRVTESQDFRGTSLETLRHMVAAGVGLSLMPKLACRTDGLVRYIPFSLPKPSRVIALYYRGNSAKNILLENIATKIKSILEKNKTGLSKIF